MFDLPNIGLQNQVNVTVTFDNVTVKGIDYY